MAAPSFIFATASPQLSIRRIGMSSFVPSRTRRAPLIQATPVIPATSFVRAAAIALSVFSASALAPRVTPVFAQAPSVPATAPKTAPPKSLPTPESVIGFAPGADYKLFTYDQSIEYFKRLAAAAPNRVKLMTVGKTAYGKPWTAVLISSPANLAKLDHIREVNMRLAHPEGLTDAEAHRLAS